MSEKKESKMKIDAEDPPVVPPPQEEPTQQAKTKMPCSIMGFARGFAYFNISLTGLTCLTTICTFLYWTVSTVVEVQNRGPPLTPPMDRDAQNMHDFYNIAMCAGILVLVMFTSIAFVFAIVLLNGVTKRKPNLVRAYFIYGVAVLVLVGLSGSTYLILSGFKDSAIAAIAIIVIFCDSVVLAFIRMAYKEIESEMVQYSPSLEVCMDQEERSPQVSPIIAKKILKHNRLEITHDKEEIEFVINNAIKHTMSQLHEDH